MAHMRLTAKSFPGQMTLSVSKKGGEVAENEKPPLKGGLRAAVGGRLMFETMNEHFKHMSKQPLVIPSVSFADTFPIQGRLTIRRPPAVGPIPPPPQALRASSPGMSLPFGSFSTCTIVQPLRPTGTSPSFGEAVRGALPQKQ